MAFMVLVSGLAFPSRAAWSELHDLQGAYALEWAGTSLIAMGEPAGMVHSTDSGRHWDTVTGFPSVRYGSLARIQNDLFLGLGDSGIYRSTDGASTWARVDQGAWKAGAGRLVAAEGSLFQFGSAGVFRSPDRGATWIPAKVAADPGSVNGFAAIGEILYATTDDGIFKSGDGGATWKAASAGLTDTWAVALGAIGNSLVAAAYGGKVFRSSDQGQTWAPIGKGTGGKLVYKFVSAGPVLYAGTNEGLGQSTDSGATWNWLNGPIGTFVFDLEIRDGALFGASTHGLWSVPLKDIQSSAVRQNRGHRAASWSPYMLAGDAPPSVVREGRPMITLDGRRKSGGRNPGILIAY